MTVLEMSEDRSMLLRHSWIADLARYYSVSSTPSYDVVTVETSVIFQGAPLSVYVHSASSKPGATFSVDDGGFAFNFMEGFRPPILIGKKSFINRRIARIAASSGVSFKRTVLQAHSSLQDLPENILLIANTVKQVVATKT